MITIVSRLSAVLVTSLTVLLITLWSVPTAWAKPCCSNFLDQCITDECAIARDACEDSGGYFTSEKNGENTCSRKSDWTTCMGDELDVCITCDYQGENCYQHAKKPTRTPLGKIQTIPFSKLTPAQQQRVRQLLARSKSKLHRLRMQRNRIRPKQKTYDLRPILKRKKLRNGNNLVYTTPMGVRVYAMQRGGKVVGWSARNRRGQSSKLRLQRGATCSACIPNKFGRSARTGKCMQKIIVGAACPSFSMGSKTTIKKTTTITPIQKKK